MFWSTCVFLNRGLLTKPATGPLVGLDCQQVAVFSRSIYLWIQVFSCRHHVRIACLFPGCWLVVRGYIYTGRHGVHVSV